MKRNSRILLIFTLGALALSGWAADTNTYTRTNYFSWQHPEWPPMPGPVASNLPTYRLHQTNLPGTNNFLMDDRGHQYPFRLPARNLQRSYMLHPERMPDLRGDTLQAEEDAARTGNSERAQLLRQRLQAAEEYQSTNPPAPYTWSMESQLRSAVVMAEHCRTNLHRLGTNYQWMRMATDEFQGSFQVSQATARKLLVAAPLILRVLETERPEDFQAFLDWANANHFEYFTTNSP